MATTSAKGDRNGDRIRYKDNVLPITFTPHPPTFLAARPTAYASTMGVPQPGGHHLFFPEEAVFLAECGFALIQLPNGRPLCLEECYQTLERIGISFPVYFTYVTLKRAGYIPARPVVHKKPLPQEGDDKEEDSDDISSFRPHSPFPSSVLDALPSMGSSTHLSVSNMDGDTLPFRGMTVDERMVEMVNARTFKTTNRTDKRPIRPRYWPSLEQATECRNWREYAQKRRDLLNRDRHFSRGEASSGLRPDQYTFDVYLPGTFAHHYRTPPAYKVRVLNSAQKLPSIPEAVDGSRVIFAFTEGPRVNFVDTSGGSIQLNPI